MMSYDLKWEDKGVSWKYYGQVSGKEIIEASKIIYGDPRFDELRYKLVDFLETETIEMDNHEIDVIASQHKASEMSNPNIKNAIVIRSSASQLATKFAAFFSDSSWEVQIFQDLDKANNWLGREPST